MSTASGQKRISGKSAVLPLGLLILPLLFSFHTAELSASLSSALDFIGSSLIPALFPFLFAGQLLTAPAVFFRLARLTEHFFPVCLSAALLGGYPTGAVLLAGLVRGGLLDAETAGRWLPVLSFPSPAFLLGIVGRDLLRSPEAGLILYAAVLLGSLPAGLLLFRGRKHSPVPLPAGRPPLSADLLPRSVEKAGAALMSVCSAVLAASCLTPFLAMLPLSESASALLSAFLEVGGLRLIAGARSRFLLYHLAAALTLGGVSVWMQLAAVLNGTGVRLRLYLLTRPLCALSSCGFLFLLLRIFPVSLPASAPMSSPFSASPLSSCLLLGMIALITAVPGRREA